LLLTLFSAALRGNTRGAAAPRSTVLWGPQLVGEENFSVLHITETFKIWSLAAAK